MIPQPGDIVLITSRCGAQFRGRQMRVLVTKVETFTHTPDHMVHLAGYELNDLGVAIEQRPVLLVEYAGVDLIERPAITRRPRNAGPSRIPQQQRRASTGTSTNRTVR